MTEYTFFLGDLNIASSIIINIIIVIVVVVIIITITDVGEGNDVTTEIYFVLSTPKNGILTQCSRTPANAGLYNETSIWSVKKGGFESEERWYY